MADLLLTERIDVETDHGHCEIHLNFGSITKLKKEDAVDVLVVSAFPGDYSPTPTSVIGALKRELNINVRELSRDKEEDHRRLFSCWWSKPLPKGYSFQKILCFEGSFKRGSRPPMVVGEVFRSLVSMCKEKDIKVIMPLLAAGDQGYNQKMMLRLIVETAIHWMRIGLPLKILKIVIFSRNNDKVDSNPLLKYYKELKQKWTKILQKEDDKPQEHPINYDVYLSYNVEDKPLANTVMNKLKERHGFIKIFSEHQDLDHEKSWQDGIYQVMVTCARVITILTPKFLADEACLEQYNIALCCTRNMKRDYLAPFYVDSIDEMPTYMCLIQYVDCRPADDEKVSQACNVVIDWLRTHLAEITLHEKTKKLAVSKLSERKYDVFISYSHQNSDAAHEIKRILSLFHPDWNIFIDIAELQTGVAWQMKLYNSIEASRYVITLLSPPYLKSKVCQEEYNLALAMHSDTSYSTRLIPILVESVERLPAWCRDYTPIDCRDASEKAIMEVVQKIAYYEKINHLEAEDTSAIQDITSCWRTEHIRSGLKFLPGLKIDDIVKFSPKQITPSSNNVDVALCFDEKDRIWGEFLLERLHHYLPNARISLPEENKVRHSLLDDALLIVPLLSCAFTRSAELTEELNTALCRQRFNSSLVLFPIALESLGITSPVYFDLLWTLISCEDKVWQDSRRLKEPASEELKASEREKCLDFSARLISYIVTNQSLFQGSFKTLLSTEEMRYTTLRFRAKRPVDSIGFNPLYFEEARVGHVASEVSTTVKKDLCHSVNGHQTKVKDPSNGNTTPKNHISSDKKLTAPVQESFASVAPSICVSDANEGDKAPPQSTTQATQLNTPIEERNKLSKQPSENVEDDFNVPADEEEGTHAADRVNRVELQDPHNPTQRNDSQVEATLNESKNLESEVKMALTQEEK